MIIFTLTVIAVLVGSLVVEQVQCARTVKKRTSGSVVSDVQHHCFPAVGFKMPNTTPTSLTNWWCNTDTEYAFVGFSYDISPCPSLAQLKTHFSDMRKTFNTRYVRLYENCDNKGFYDDVIEAAWNAGIGVHALIWFGFTGGNQWETRRDTLFNTLHSNPRAKFVTRLVQFGSEPLFDSVLDPPVLGAQVAAAMKNLSSLQIQVDISELAYGWQESESEGSLQIMGHMGSMVSAHVLPFFDYKASTANQSWPLVLTNIEWFQANALNKKLWLDEVKFQLANGPVKISTNAAWIMIQNGWPSATSDGIQPNNKSAVANIQNEHDYFALLDKNCQYFKKQSIGWFAHTYNDQDVEAYGIYDLKGALKFPFRPRTSC